MRSIFTVGLAVATLALAAAPARASVIEIQFAGLDLVYTGNDLVDAGSFLGGSQLPGESDPLAAVNFLFDGVLVGSFTEDVYGDFGALAQPNIPAGGGSVSWAFPGFFDLFSSVLGWNIGLDLSGLQITSTGGSPVITGQATVAQIFGQNLPFELVASDPVLVSFSIPAFSSVSSSGGFLSEFTATADGTVTAAAVPEPSSLLLLGGGGALLAYWRRRQLTMSR